ncbi:hypothetical protein [Nostoc sp.]|uniref:hypothetical protein n=1 Tax=Nostoc sp. TaxID=1180 RepID=UPI002FFA75C4
MPLNPSTAVAPHERLHQAEGIERNHYLLCETLRERSGTKSGYWAAEDFKLRILDLFRPNMAEHEPKNLKSKI